MNHAIKHGFRNLSHREVTTVSNIAILVAVISTLYIIYDLGYMSGQNYVRELYNETRDAGFPFPNVINDLQIGIVISFVISAVGIRVRNAIGFFISMLALSAVCMAYVWWYDNSMSFMRALDISDYSQLVPNYKHAWMLRDARWWDVVVLLLSLTLLGWQIKTLLSFFAGLKAPDKT